MILAILLIIFIIVLISALLYILGCLVAKRMISRRKKYQDHIDSQRSPMRLQAILDGLPATVQRYDEIVKHSRARKMRQYFHDKSLTIKEIAV